jgi:hypothetical protein
MLRMCPQPFPARAGAARGRRMRGIVSIFSAMMVLTLGYSWTVGQSSLLQTNKNLCELWNAVSPVPYSSCEFHYVLVGGWTVAAVIVTIILATRSALWVRQTALPHGGIRPLSKHWYTASAPYLAKLRPHHVITLGLTIALIGVIWQWRRPAVDPLVADLRTQLDLQAKEIERLKKQGVTTVPSIPPAASNPSPPGGLSVLTPLYREFTNRTPRQLLAFYEGRTPFQADKLIEPFKGLWIEAESKVLNILPDGSDRSIVVLRNDKDTIECRFGPYWSNAVARLDAGDTLRVWGKISPNQNGSQLYLLECEIARSVKGNTDPSHDVAPKQQESVFAWDFSRLLGGSVSPAHGHYISVLCIEGSHDENIPVQMTDASIISNLEPHILRMRIDTDRGYVLPQDSYPIPPGAHVRLQALLYDPETPDRTHPEGIPADQFLKTWGAFGFHVSYTRDGTKESYSQKFDYRTISARVAAMNPRPISSPRVTARQLDRSVPPMPEQESG